MKQIAYLLLMNTYQHFNDQILSRPNTIDDFFDRDKQFHQNFIDSWNLFQIAPSLEIPSYMVALKQNIKIKTVQKLLKITNPLTTNVPII